ncbi:MAG: adenine phosphoribosyltransferase [Verrucomicrobiales bacterium]|nr:adenine phosphoribosyltransferase [Verrucomicrobiales bacterium]
MDKLEKSIRDVPDFPKPGIIFKDITPILADPDLLYLSIKALASFVEDSSIDKVIGIDARGFIFGSLVANSLGKGFIPVRKEGKLPWKTESESYELEYGQSVIEIHQDAVLPGERILIIDDLLATGGTAAATIKLVNKLGGIVDYAAFFIELEFLNGRELLKNCEVHSVLNF